MPLHNGSLTLCKVAQELSDKIVVIVLGTPKDQISIKIREQWLHQELPNAQIKNHQISENVQLTAKGFKPLLNEIKGIFPHYRPHFFGSNPIIAKLASKLMQEYTILDPDHLAQNIKSSAVLSDPYKNWSSMPQSVKIPLIKRVVLIGPESVGKSSLAKKLNQQNPKISWLPEYGRNYELFRKPGLYKESEFTIICDTHAAHRKALLPFSEPIFLEDTDELATSVWSEMLIQKTLPEIENRIKLPDMYFLMDPSVPFVAEKIRYFDKEKRQEFFFKIKKKLDIYNAPYKVLTGSWQERETKALKTINQLLNEPPKWSTL